MHVGKNNPGFTHSIVLSELISVTGEWHLEILVAQHSIAPKKTQIQIPREDLGAKELVQKEKKIKRWSDYSRQTPSRGGGNAHAERALQSNRVIGTKWQKAWSWRLTNLILKPRIHFKMINCFKLFWNSITSGARQRTKRELPGWIMK